MTLKYAQTLDGRVATGSGHSQWISGLPARRLAHRLRAEHDAVLVGAGTVATDDPALTVRLVDGRNPIRVVLDTHLRISPAAQVVRDGLPTVLVTVQPPASRPDLLAATNVRLLTVSGTDAAGRIDLAALLPKLRDEGVGSLLVEGGPTVATAFLRARLVDRVVIITAPRLSGSGRDAVGDLGTRAMDEAIGFADVTYEILGEDMVFRGRPVYPDRY